ncbi:hypothetical protein [Demequina litorisediminis]|uniref:Uncharacterized protein n=1 Tax=Demequina litorisediminis TaxID=1849022 RepID=A0ABQ6IAR0_9MICO|nr:hypothetical protein GCM10025876_11360 [Demequina litorisediminis]
MRLVAIVAKPGGWRRDPRGIAGACGSAARPSPPAARSLLDGARDRITATRGSNDEVADGLADAGVIGIIPADQGDNA